MKKQLIAATYPGRKKADLRGVVLFKIGKPSINLFRFYAGDQLLLGCSLSLLPL